MKNIYILVDRRPFQKRSPLPSVELEQELLLELWPLISGDFGRLAIQQTKQQHVLNDNDNLQKYSSCN